MFLTLMRPSLVLFLVLWLKLVKDFLKVRCRLALLPFLISCLIWLDLVASLPLIKERILVIILLLHFLSLMLGSRSEERFSRNAETDLVCRLLLEKKKKRDSRTEEVMVYRRTGGYVFVLGGVISCCCTEDTSGCTCYTHAAHI